MFPQQRWVITDLGNNRAAWVITESRKLGNNLQAAALNALGINPGSGDTLGNADYQGENTLAYNLVEANVRSSQS